jgi:hypothetical protein
MAAAVEGTRIPHRVCRYSNFYESVMAPQWCTELRNVLSDYYLRCGLDLYRVPEREWAGYFRAVHQGEMSIDDLAVLFALAEDA